MATIRLENVTKVYDNGHVAVHDATFEIADGELVVLVGPSGCGKSTTLRMVAGLEAATSGVIRINDTIVNDKPPKDRDVAMVFQNYALYPHMTVYENMAFGLKLRKYPRQEIKQRVEQAADMLDLGTILDRKPRQLSGGQRQRVALGRAIVRKPQVFLFDEPLSNLDAKLRVQMRTEIARLHQRLDATMLYVTHDQVEAMTMGNRIVVMKDGHIQQIDAPLNLYNYPANQFVAGFIGSPSMNLFTGHIKDEKDPIFYADDDTFRIVLKDAIKTPFSAFAGRPIVLGCRPENLHIPGVISSEIDTQEIEVTIDVKEPMGNEIFIYGHTGRHALVARVPPQALSEPGTSIRLTIELDKLHFFDAETGMALTKHAVPASDAL